MKISKIFKGLLVLLSVVTPSIATHVRGATLTYEVIDPVTKTVRFDATVAVRSTWGDYDFSVDYGDGSDSGPISVSTIGPLQVDATGETYNLRMYTVTYEYGAAAAGPYTAFHEACCRISTLEESPDGDYRFETTVDFNDPKPPKALLPAIVQFNENIVSLFPSFYLCRTAS